MDRRDGASELSSDWSISADTRLAAHGTRGSRVLTDTRAFACGSFVVIPFFVRVPMGQKYICHEQSGRMLL